MYNFAYGAQFLPMELFLKLGIERFGGNLSVDISIERGEKHAKIRKPQKFRAMRVRYVGSRFNSQLSYTQIELESDSSGKTAGWRLHLMSLK